MRETTRVASSECPPSSKKLSSTPTRSRRSTSAQIPASTSSTGVRGATYASSARRVLRRRQRLAVQLAVGREGKRLQLHERRRHHVLRQAAAGGRAQRLRIRSPDDVRHEPRFARVLARHHHAIRQAGAAQDGLDLAQLHAVAADLHLLVQAAHVLQGAVRIPADLVARAVQPRAGHAADVVRHVAIGRERRAAQVAARDALAAQVQLAGHADGHGFEAPRRARTPANCSGCARWSRARPAAAARRC